MKKDRKCIKWCALKLSTSDGLLLEESSIDLDIEVLCRAFGYPSELIKPSKTYEL